MSRPRLLITGASRGIGAAIARAAATQGARLLVNYLSRADLANEVASAVKAAGGEAIVMQGDVRRPDDAAKLVAAAAESWAGLDWLVNNAHTPYRHVRADQLEWHDYEEQIDGTLRAAVNMTEAAMPHLLRSSRASILNMSSITARIPAVGLTARSTAKAALEGYTRSIAHEYAGRVRVNALAAGWTRTSQFDTLADDVLRDALATTPAGRFASPDEIARTALFLLSDDASFISGLVLPVAGGLGWAGGA